jgi:hypothetical protein
MDEYDAVLSKAKAAYYDRIREASQKGVLAGLMTMMGNPFRDPDSAAFPRKNWHDTLPMLPSMSLPAVQGKGLTTS